MTNRKLMGALVQTIEALNLPELNNMVLAWDCDLCGTVMTDEKACTKCGYTWDQKCERWP